MRFGIMMFVTDRSIPPGELAREVEDRGFVSLFFPDHTHIPASRATPAPMGEPLPEQYRRMIDVFVAMAAAATATTSLKVGSGVALIAQRDPIITAKEVASIDHLSGGRAVLGIGFGWNVEEMADHGVEYARRRALVREKMLAIKRLWSEDEASYEGEYVRFERAWSWPKPVQAPGVPVFMGGGAGPKLFAHVAEYADGWMPIGGRGLAESIPHLQKAFADAGRDPSSLEVMPCGTIPNPGKIERLASLGIKEIVLGSDTGTRDEVLPALDKYAEIVEPYRS